MVLAFAKRIVPKSIKDILRPAYHKLVHAIVGTKPGKLSHKEIASLLNSDNPTIFEIGCNDGSDTVEFIRNYANPRIFCFEPEPRAIQRFKRRLRDDLQSVTLCEIALSDKEGQIEFFRSDGEAGTPTADWDMSGSIRAPKHHLEAHPNIRFGSSIFVETTTLDRFCEKHSIESIDFIWMDVQGAEIDVIRGGRNILKKCKFIYTEYNDNEMYEGQASLEQITGELPDFEILVRYSDDVLLKNRKVL